ncbi:MAG: Gmad2 immunoglobulin-like domain-containing protein [Actinomycetota bacterium]|nr:Gmad2 immunoglobulin-like domain-containing protein [Actinomycetota bacterium]
MRAKLTIGMLIALSVAACSPSGGQAATTATGAGITSTTSITASTTTLPLVAGCEEGGEFFEGGGQIGSIDHPGSDSTTIGTISWNADTSCETFTISFVTSEGAPPTTPPTVSAFYVGDSPIVRLHMDVEGTVITDQLVETQFVDRLYVIRALDGGMFIDLHLAAPAQARIETSSSPAELIVDLQPGLLEYPVAAAASDIVVVTSPLDSAVISGELLVEGYSRTFEANVMMIVTQGADVLAETFTTAADWVETWGEFRATLALEPGDYSLFVGEESPEDGSLEGLTIDLMIQ